MRVPEHYVHVYAKPTQSEGFQARYRVFNYKHKIESFGGDATASCEIDVNLSQAEYFYNSFLGNRVAFYVDNPAEPIWEGIISRITLSNGGIKRTTSIDEMANSLQTAGQRGAVTTARILTTQVNNTESQAIYGIKEETLDGPAQSSASNTIFEALRAQTLADRAWPQNSAVPESSGGLSLSIECIGFSQTLEWETIYTTGALADTADLSPTVDIGNQLTNLRNGNTFFDNTDTSLVETNTTFTVRKRLSTGSTKLEWLLTLASAGDGTVQWVFGITPTVNGQRRFYYKAATTTVQYTAYIRDGLTVRNQFGREIPMWSIRPDASLKIVDLALAFNDIGDDPRITYLSSIDYDQSSQKVTWTSEDDITIDGALKFKKPVKSYGMRSRARSHRSGV